MAPRCAAIILAAGYSSRMEDGFKPLMPIQGRSLLAHCIHLFKKAPVEQILVVCGHRHREVAAEAEKKGALPVFNPQYDQGMFTSIQTPLPLIQQVDGFFLLPVDIAGVRPDTLRRLLAAFDGTTLVHPVHAGAKGHPPLIPTSLIPAILSYTGPGGLVGCLARVPAREVPVWDEGIHRDADTREQFLQLSKRFERMAVGSRAEAETLASLSMPVPVTAHCRAVAHVADLIAQRLWERGLRLDRDIVHNAALLHDIAKGQPHHEERGGEMLQELGLTRLAEPVRLHRDVGPVNASQVEESAIVCLADKLVSGTELVPLWERFARKLDLYRHDTAACQAINNRLQHALQLQHAVEQCMGLKMQALLFPTEETLRQQA